jgi:hypothetical protein
VVQPPENGVLFRQYERISHLKYPGWAVSVLSNQAIKRASKIVVKIQNAAGVAIE